MASLFCRWWTRCRGMCWLLLGQHKRKWKMNMLFLNAVLVSSRLADQLFILLGRHRGLARVELLSVARLFALPTWQRSSAWGPHRGQQCCVNTKGEDGPGARDLAFGNRLWTRFSQLVANTSNNLSCWWVTHVPHHRPLSNNMFWHLHPSHSLNL